MKFIIELSAQEAAIAEERNIFEDLALIEKKAAGKDMKQVAEAPAPMPVDPTVPVQDPQDPQQQPQPAEVPVSVVPTEVAAYTQNDLALAASGLMDAGKQADLLGLLQKFGVPSLVDLKTEQYGAFAADLRTLGAKI